MGRKYRIIFLISGIIFILFLSYSSVVSSQGKRDEYYYSPISGLPLENKPSTRPVAAVIENSSKARPQKALDRATVVYEILAEGGITRFLALFWEDIPEEMGPIRSMRSYFLDIIFPFHPLILHCGASPDGFSRLQELDVENLDQLSNSSYYYRDNDRETPHNLFTTERIIDYLYSLSSEGYESIFSFNEVSIINSDARKAQKIVINYWNDYRVIYQYKNKKNIYRRYLNSLDNPHHVEREKFIDVNNIIVQYVSTEIKDEQGRMDVKLRGEGEALIFDNGRVREGQWEKEDLESPIKYYNEQGQEVSLNPGKTWVQIVPENSEVEW